MQERVYDNAYRTTVVCIDSGKDGFLSGRLYHPSLSNGVVFENMMQFLLTMEDLLDKNQLPQSFTSQRKFSKRPEVTHSFSDNEMQVGEVATFFVRVIFRQNASWQGSVIWLETGREESFRSALELLLLMESVVGCGQQTANQRGNCCHS